MTDIVICILPKINPDAPTVGPAVLKSHLLANGIKCEVIDFNVLLFNELKNHDRHNYYYFENDVIFNTQHDGVITDEFSQFYTTYFYIFLDWIETLKSKNTEWIGLSLLSDYSLAIAIKLSELIRIHIPKAKIVWGGGQVSGSTRPFRNSGLIDHYIAGDSEFALVELLKGNTEYAGINSGQGIQIKDLNSVMLPNYDDINWDLYGFLDYNRPAYITGSRGCVKRCTFCNVYDIWPEYKFRSAKSIVSEITYVREKYRRITFRFTDSLINGSMKAFREMLHALKEHRKTDLVLSWTSQWIIRSKSQMPEDDYRLMAESGCIELEIGIESFSQPVRYHMGKKFTDEDMWWCFDMLQKYKIPHTMLMIVGYPTETTDDHQHTINTIKELHRRGYMHNTNSMGSPLMYLRFTNTLMLHAGQPLWDIVNHNIKNYKSVTDWDYNDNTSDVRISRINELNNLVMELQETLPPTE